MGLRSWGRLTVLIGAALTVPGCGQIGSAGAVPQGATTQARAHRATSGDLIYATGGCGGVCVLSYPQGQIVNSIHTTGQLGALCSDASGNVFVSNDTQVLEYTHGGTSPIATLSLPGHAGYACSVDPTTNNLAVVFKSDSGDIAVFANESGTPSIYASTIDSLVCGYDNAGNLLIGGFNGLYPGLAELPQGQGAITVLSISGTLGNPGQVQWDGSHMTYETISSQRISVAQLSISGSLATVIGTTPIKGVKFAAQSWIYDRKILVPSGGKAVKVNKIGVWAYPKGGKTKDAYKLANPKSLDFQGVTVSVAPNS